MQLYRPDARACLMANSLEMDKTGDRSNAHDEGVHCQRPSQEAAMPLTVYGICGRRNGCLATRRRRALIRIRIARNLGYDRAA